MAYITDDTFVIFQKWHVHLNFCVFKKKMQRGPFLFFKIMGTPDLYGKRSDLYVRVFHIIPTIADMFWNGNIIASWFSDYSIPNNDMSVYSHLSNVPPPFSFIL